MAILGSRGYFFSYWYRWFAVKPRQRGTKRRGHRSYESHFISMEFKDHISHQTGLELMGIFVFIDADSWDLIVCGALHLPCMKKELNESSLRKESAIKNCPKFFSKKYTSSFKYIKRTEVSWEVWEHTLELAVFRSQQDKKNFRSTTHVLLYQVKLNIARQNGFAKPNLYHSAAFFSK